MPNYENLRPFDTLPEDKHRELSRRGGIASGESRRDKAEAREKFQLYMAVQELATETRAEYRAAIKRYVREVRKKAARRKKVAKKSFTKTNKNGRISVELDFEVVDFVPTTRRWY